MAAALVFVPPLVAAIGYALYEKVFSEEDRITHSIGASILWDRTASFLAPKPHPIFDRIEIMGVRDDDSFFHYQKKEITNRFLKYWRKYHNELPFREDLDTFLEHMKLPEFETILRCDIHLFFKEGIDDVDWTHHEATYYWVRDQQPSMMAFPVYDISKENSDEICFVQKIICATISTGKDEKNVTDTIKRIAGPHGNFYQDVPEIHRPKVNLALAFWNERSDGFRYLNLTDTLGLTYCYDLENYIEAQWPTDAHAHMVQ